MRIIKAGILDDVNVINSLKPGAELYAPERVKWVQALDGAGQVDAMPAGSLIQTEFQGVCWPFCLMRRQY